MKTRRFFFGSLVLPATFFVTIAGHVLAADQTWNGATDGIWATGTNWSGAADPGAVSGIISGDTATFNNNVNTTVTVDAYRNIKNIIFDSGAGLFVFSGGQFGLTNAGAITMNAGVTNTETINTNILLSTTANSTYSFINNSSTPGAKLNFGGNITGQTTATVETLFLGGTNGGTISGVISNGTLGGTVALTKSGAGNWTLFGANTYTGTTNITAGTVVIGNAKALGASRVNLTAGSTIDLNGNNLSLDFLNNGAALAGGVVDNVSAGGNVTLTVGGNQGGVNAASGTYTNIDTFSGVIQNTTGSVGLTKVSPSVANQTIGIMATASLMNGPDMLRLTNVNTYTGATTVKGGALELNFNQLNNGGAAVTTNIISSSSPLVLAGGEVIVDSIGTTAAQTFASLTLNAGASHVAAYRNTSGAASLNLQTVTRNIGGTLDFQSRPTGSSSNAKIGAADGNSTIKTPNANFTGGGASILGGYAIFNQSTWAVGAASGTTQTTVTGLSTYSATYTAATNVDSAIGTQTPGVLTLNSLRFNTAGAYTINTGGNLTIATGGILETTGVGANAVAINNNNLTSNNGQDLIVIQNNSLGGMTIGSNITGAIGLTKSGVGSLTLTPNTANTFTGQLTINAGTVVVGNANALNSNGSSFNDVVFGGTTQLLGGATPSWAIQNGTLTLNGFNATVGSLSSSADSSGTAIVQNANATAKTLTINGTTTASFAGTLQDGAGGGALSVVKAGAGTQTLLNNTYTGNTTVNGGTLAVKNTILSGASPTITVAGGATLDVSAVNGGLTLSSSKTLTSSAAVSTTATVLGSTTISGGVLNTGVASGLAFSTLQFGSLALNSGNYNFSITDPTVSTGVSSLVNVTTANGLTISGGTVNLSGGVFNFGSTYNLTYNLFQFAGTLGGSASNLTLAGGSQVNGLGYAFGTSGNFVTLSITGAPLFIGNWITDGSNSWNTAGNWDVGIVPDSQFATANLGGAAATHANLTRAISLDGNKTIGALNFAPPNGEGYTVSQGTGGTLTFNNGATAATISAVGTHTLGSTLPVNLSSNLSVGTSGSGDKLTIAGVIANTNTGTLAATLTKTGSGTLVLSNANTYGPAAAGTVGTNLNAGTIQVGNSGSLGAGDVTFGGSATLQSGAAALNLANNMSIGAGFTATADTKGNIFTLSGVLSGATGALTVATSTGNGSLILTGANTYGGGTTINTGATLQVGDNSATGSLPSTGTIANGSSLVFKRSDAVTFAVGNTINGIGNLTQNGGSGNVLQLNGNNGYSGGTTITTGSIQLGNNNGIGSGDVSIASGASLDLNAKNPTVGGLNGAGAIDSTAAGTMTLSLGNNNNGGIFTGIIQNTLGTIGVTKNGIGSEILSGNNTFGGAINVSQGTLTIGGASNLTGQVTISTANLGGSANLVVANTAVINSSVILRIATATTASPGSLLVKDSASVTAASFNYGSNFGTVGNASVTVQDMGSLAINGTFNLNNIAGSGTNTLTVNLNGGTLAVGSFIQGSNANAANAQNGVIRFNGGTLKALASDAGAGVVFLPAPTVAGRTSTFVDSGGALIDSNGFNITVANPLLHGTGTPDGGLTKSGSGSLSLTASNTYTGATIVNNGTLYVNTANAASNRGLSFTSGVTINSGGTLQSSSNALFGWDGSQVKNITVNTGGILTADNNTDVRVGLVTLAGGSLQSVGTSVGYGSWVFDGVSGVLAATDNSTASAVNVRMQNGASIDVSATKNLSFTGTITDTTSAGNSTLIKTGAGTLTLSSTNTFTGGTTVSGGLLNLGHVTDTLADLGTITVNGGTLAIGPNSDTVGAVTLTSGSITGSTGVLTGSSYATANGTISAILGGAGTLTQVGSGTTTLNAANTYTGATTINNGGTLALGATGSIASSSIITANGTFDVSTQSGVTIGVAQVLKGSGTVNVGSGGNLAIDGILAAGNSPGVLTVSDGGAGTSSTSFNTGSIFSWDLDTTLSGRGTAYDGVNTSAVSGSGAVFQVVLQGAQSFGDAFWTSAHTWSDIFTTNGTTPVSSDLAAVFSTFTYANGSGVLGTPSAIGSFSITGSTLSWSAVPEPTSALAGLLLGAGLLRRRRTSVAVRQ